MSTTVTYKGSTLTTVNNQTRTLKTAGKYMEGDVILTDSSNEVWKPVQAQTRTIIEDPNGNYLWYDNTTPAFAEGQTWRVTWGNETYIVQTKYGTLSGGIGWFLGNPGAVGEADDGSGYTWLAWNPQSGVTAIGTSETGSKKVILELQQSNPYQAKTVTYTPSETQQTATVVPDSGYNGLSTVGITVNAISSTYVGSGITRRTSSDLTASGATVSVPAGYYSAAASKSVASGSATAPASISGTAASVSTGNGTLTLTKTVSVTPTVSAGYISSGTAGNSSVSLTASVTIDPTPTASGATVTIPAGYYTEATSKAVTTMTLPTSAASSATSGYTKKATISRSTSTQYINIAPGYNSAGGYYEISAVANGSATGPSSLSGSSATVSTGTNTLTLTKTGVTTTPTVTAGYVSSATASTATVTLTASVTTKAAATITPTTTNQTIAAGTYLTGAQTIAGDADLIGGNILSTANIFGVQGTVVVQNYYTGSSAPSSSLGSNGDLYLQS